MTPRDTRLLKGALLPSGWGVATRGLEHASALSSIQQDEDISSGRKGRRIFQLEGTVVANVQSLLGKQREVDLQSMVGPKLLGTDYERP